MRLIRKATTSRPSLLASSRARVLADASHTLPQMVQGILFVFSTPLEWSDARIPLVVAANAVACARNTEGGISMNEIGLLEDHLHCMASLRPLNRPDEGP